MPLYMDIHKKVDGVTPMALAEAHRKDVQTQSKYGVKFRKYWLDDNTKSVFCLAEAPSKEAMINVHKEAHGLLADEIHEVIENT